MSLTKRQRKILKIVIDEFIKTGQPVGSIAISKDYNLGISPATLRAEMSNLVDQGFLYKEHSSSGRVPTTLGIRHYISNILKEELFNKHQEAKLKERIFQKRFDKYKFVREAVRALSEMGNIAALSIVDDVIFYSGIGQFLAFHDLEDLVRIQKILEIVESESLLLSLFDKYSTNNDLKILIGDEIGLDPLSDCSIVYSPFRFFRGKKGYLAAVGPRSMRYSQVIPAVRDVSLFLENAIRGWE